MDETTVQTPAELTCANYADMNLSPEVLRAVTKKGYVTATPVQTLAIPEFMAWKDVIAKAPTGTGKTFAFGIPM
ncbi:MAG: DEAD/DEAH box helicase, partial [Oscillospiraceae bacterium]